MKTQITKQIAKLTLVALAAFAMAGVAQASTCGLAPEVLKDTQDLAAKIAADFKKDIPELKTVSLNSDNKPQVDLLDGKFHKIDRSRPVLKQLDSVGVISEKSLLAGGTQVYGSAVLVSPCHVITNRHVVENIAKHKGTKLEVGNEVNFSVGQSKTCDPKNPFLISDLQAKVLEFGKTESGRAISGDWAIVKLSRPILNHEVKPAKVTTRKIGPGEYGMQVGYPGSEIKDQFGFAYLRGSYIEGKGGGLTGITTISDSRAHYGISGGGIFGWDVSNNNEVFVELTALTRGGKDTISMSSIINQMKESESGLQVLEEMKRSLKTQSCE